MQLKNRTAVVTGAAGGIGRAIALSLARRDCHLALCDIDASGMDQTQELLKSLPVRCTTYQLDVANREQVAALPGQVLRDHGEVHVVINNAGVALGGTFEQVTEEQFDWLMEINFHSQVRMTRAFLPHLRRANAASIVNVSSLYGLISPPGQCAYSASKFAVRGFTNALRNELASSNVNVTVVHPGGVATSIAKNARIGSEKPTEQAVRDRNEAERFLRLPPERAGEIIVSGIERNAARILVGNDAKLVSLVERLLPVRHVPLLAWLTGRKEQA